MGTWGTAILSNDTASDVAAEFKDSIADGKSIEEAEDQLIADFCIDDEEDPYAFCPFWLGLAAKQVQMGRLSERTKTNALRIIDDGIDIAIWEQEVPKDVKKRQAALDKLRAQIVGPQKEPTKVRKPFIDNIEWEEGDGLAYQLPSGKWTALRVRKVVREPKQQSAFYEVLDILQLEIPTATNIRNAKMKLSKYAENQLKDLKLAEAETKAAYERLQRSVPKKSKFSVFKSKRYEHIMDSAGFWQCRSSSRDNPPRPFVKVAESLHVLPKEPVLGCWLCDDWRGLDKVLK
ncbi:MAG: DUF4259 domain-containing protein, partial [Phycisphaerales bacterium]